ncbi:VOC family protein [Jeotgalicoccus huakuii]|nr:VOC family protein [Jeotgalicoccus huakuii]
MNSVLGHHHISMMTKDAEENNRFYNEVLGLRRLKVTVNQDDPSMYHIFFGDKKGTPGTELTFFEMPNIGQTHKGTNAITRIGLLVKDEAALNYWQQRFDEYGVEYGDIKQYAGKRGLPFVDPDGLHLVLQVADQVDGNYLPWADSAVPVAHQIISMGTVELTAKRLDKLEKTLIALFDYEKVAGGDNQRLYRPKNGNHEGEILTVYKDGLREKPGRGSVHHLAINVQNDDELKYWHEMVTKRGFRSTGVIDRHFFKSMYFRESNGIMFEIATLDGPGMTDDEANQSLGNHLDLPPFLEEKRTQIEEDLIKLSFIE